MLVGGVIESYENYFDSGYTVCDDIIEGAFVLALESNIPFKRGKAFCFSPSVIGIKAGGKVKEFIFPLLVGYKLKLSQNSLLIPKVGLNVGGVIYGKTYGVVGPSVALSFEHKHFIMGVNGGVMLLKTMAPPTYLLLVTSSNSLCDYSVF